MPQLPIFINRVFSFVLRLVLWAFAAVFAASLLLAGLILLALGLLRALITGQKPKPMVFGRFQRFSPPPMCTGHGPRGAAAPRQAEVVDVEVREIRGDKPPH